MNARLDFYFSAQLLCALLVLLCVAGGVGAAAVWAMGRALRGGWVEGGGGSELPFP